MSSLDWTILVGTLFTIVVYGIWTSKQNSNTLNSFLKGNNEAQWWTVGLSVMATQASAITFISTPGQGFDDGLKFVQFYFGLPLAMVVIILTFIPLYYKLKVYTAYEFLENRFDLKTRTLTSFLFLVQRGLAAGITIYAPAIILSTVVGINLRLTCLFIGVLVIIYTMSGGTKAVNATQKLQMIVMMGGMILAFLFILNMLPEGVGFKESWNIAGVYDRTNIIDLSFDMENRYTLWTGLLGGFFLSLSYFGTDQSQVQRYLSGKSIRESRLGLVFNAIFKIPMQFFILLVGVMVFVFYQFNDAPLFFNQSQLDKLEQSQFQSEYQSIKENYEDIQTKKIEWSKSYVKDPSPELAQNLQQNHKAETNLREEVKSLLVKVDEHIETNDKDYVFLNFILNNLPKGLIGLLLAMIFSAAMSSTAAELNALSTTTTIDMYKRHFKKDGDDKHYVWATKLFTLLWGVLAIIFATNGTLLENLIQFVNIIGSLFYGTILGVFLVAFFIKYIKGNAVFIAAVLAELIVLYLFKTQEISYLWFNLIGCFLVIGISLVIQLFQGIMANIKT